MPFSQSRLQSAEKCIISSSKLSEQFYKHSSQNYINGTQKFQIATPPVPDIFPDTSRRNHQLIYKPFLRSAH